jgi:hypothetical protein
MSDAQNATEKAVFVALSAAGLNNPTYQHVPQDTPSPTNIIGDMTGEPLGDKGGIDERIELSIETEMQGEQRKVVLEEQARIIATLDNQALTGATGWTINPERLSADAVLLPDGVTYLGTTRFVIFALKN